MDGSQKLPQRLLATLRLQLEQGGAIDGLALAIAAWIRYVLGTDEDGRPIEVRDPLAGTVTDGGRNRLLAVNEDFLCAFEGLLARTLAHRHQDLLQRFGKQWGLRHALRVEQVVQRRYQMTLREVESHVALELLSGSIGVLGLGSFDADLTYRDRGLIVITHHHSPFPSYFTSTSDVSCSILAGFHAAMLSYLAGRQLAAREVCCSRAPAQPCLFVIATENRLSKLFIATPGSPDHALLAEIASGTSWNPEA
jgi:predicted hydrocarbon binding protein